MVGQFCISLTFWGIGRIKKDYNGQWILFLELPKSLGNWCWKLSPLVRIILENLMKNIIILLHCDRRKYHHLEE
jgi:hypothetical protein